MRSLILLPVFALLLPASTSVAQVQDSMAYRRNVVKVNLSSRALYNSTYVLAYERVMKKGQSLGITAGYIEAPSMRLRAGMTQSEVSKSGYTIGAEYRFYLQRENRYAAPRGVYLGPYFSVHSFDNVRNLETTTGTPLQATFESGMTLTSVGIQAGYQFVLNNRWTIDIVFFGPSVTNYSLDLKLNGNFTPAEEDAIVDAIGDSFPLIGDLLEGTTVNGRTSTWYAGYRYTMQVGYNFGAKRNKGK